MRKVLAGVVAVVASAAVLAVVANVAWHPGTVRAQGQSKPLRASIVEAHEGVTIAVEPWLQASQYKQKFQKKSPFTGGIVGLRVVVRNDNDEAVRVNVNRIRLLVQLSEENRQEIESLTAEDVADTVLLKQNAKDPTSRRSPIPLPIGRPKPSRDKNWEEFKDACQNAGIPSSVVGAHSTMEGLLYFDVRGEWDLLQTARLYVPDMEKMSSKQAILYFDIDFSRGGN